jgi:hypothetical protein
VAERSAQPFPAINGTLPWDFGELGPDDFVLPPLVVALTEADSGNYWVRLHYDTGDLVSEIARVEMLS